MGLSKIQQQPAAKSRNPFTLSWTSYVELLPVKASIPLRSPQHRAFR